MVLKAQNHSGLIDRSIHHLQSRKLQQKIKTEAQNSERLEGESEGLEFKKKQKRQVHPWS